jgi:hypothetical protein
MTGTGPTRSWIWHPGVAVLAAVVGAVGFAADLSQTLSDPPVAVAVVVAGATALVMGAYLTVLTPTSDEEQPQYNWWAAGPWLVGAFLTTFVLVQARLPGGVLWPAAILMVPWFIAIFRAIPPERASRPLRGVVAACVVTLGAVMAPFAWSGNSPMPPLDGAALGYLWGMSLAAVFLAAGQSWPRVGAVLALAVALSSMTPPLFPIVPAVVSAYLIMWVRRRRLAVAGMGTA